MDRPTEQSVARVVDARLDSGPPFRELLLSFHVRMPFVSLFTPGTSITVGIARVRRPLYS